MEKRDEEDELMERIAKEILKNGDFEPVLVPKHSRNISILETQII